MGAMLLLSRRTAATATAMPTAHFPARSLLLPRRASVRCLSSHSSPQPPSVSQPQPESESRSLPAAVGVVGGGQMGTGIAYVSSVVAQLPVTLVDSRQSQLESSRAMIRALLDKDERKGKLSAAARRDAEQRFAFSTDINTVRRAATTSTAAHMT